MNVPKRKKNIMEIGRQKASRNLFDLVKPHDKKN